MSSPVSVMTDGETVDRQHRRMHWQWRRDSGLRGSSWINCSLTVASSRLRRRLQIERANQVDVVTTSRRQTRPAQHRAIVGDCVDQTAAGSSGLSSRLNWRVWWSPPLMGTLNLRSANDL